MDPASFGTRTSTSTSSGASAVSKTPVKNSVAGMTRSPAEPLATSSAPSASTTAGMSEAGSPCESVPPIVPRWRTWGSPIWAAVCDTIGQCSASSVSDATAECRVIAPIATCVPPSLTYERSPSRPRSTSFAGRAMRSLSNGISDCPPASTFVSPPPAASSSIACSTLSATS